MLKQFSEIQDAILLQLKYKSSARYGELKLKHLPNDLFNYHLQFLVQKGYIEKTEDGYALSDLGQKYVADPVVAQTKTDQEKSAQSSSDISQHMFKINVITIVSRTNSDGDLEILNQIRTAHPSYGKKGCPGGVIKREEPMALGAERVLKTETGLSAEFVVKGIERRMLYKKGELFSDVLFPIAYAEHAEGELQETKFGTHSWVGIDEAITNESSVFDSIPAIVSVLTELKNKTLSKLPFFYTEVVQSDTEENTN